MSELMEPYLTDINNLAEAFFAENSLRPYSRRVETNYEAREDCPGDDFPTHEDVRAYCYTPLRWIKKIINTTRTWWEND